MSFGQATGRPATPKQTAYLLSLLEKAGHSGFADARGPLGFTSKQARGKFTAQEASEFIEALEAAQDAMEELADGPSTDVASIVQVQETMNDLVRISTQARKQDAESDKRIVQERAVVRKLSDTTLADELVRRGWMVIPPTDSLG